jgi:hypothetical protein
MTNEKTSPSSRFPINQEGKAQCLDCGEFKVDTMAVGLPGFQRTIRKGPYCETCQAKRDEAERQGQERREQARARFRRENIEALMARVGVPRRYLACSLENFIGKPPATSPTFISGPPGTGKNHLAAGFLRERILAHGEGSCRFIRTVDLLKEIRASFSDTSGDTGKAAGHALLPLAAAGLFTVRSLPLAGEGHSRGCVPACPDPFQSRSLGYLKVLDLLPEPANL